LYGTQFSHVQSMNVAIRAGFVLGWTELMIGKAV
ncbi:MAG: GNAT family N-acetyltransferase, partial [Lactobacillaceae bacterium]